LSSKSAGEIFQVMQLEGGFMFDTTEEHVFQFEVTNDAQRRDNGRSYFEQRAKDRAAELGCHVVGLKNVQLDFLRGRWKVTGTAILEKMKATG
jgi:hypothetical protein